MEVRFQQVMYGVAEVIATHNLLRYVRSNTADEKIRMAAGAGMAGLGYVFGPELEGRIRTLNDIRLTEQVRKSIVYAAGGAVLGAMVGRAVGPRLSHQQLPARLDTLLADARTQIAADRRRPGGLVVIASAGWLGYSLFFDGKTPEEQKRHLWGLGSGAVGYMYGPELLGRLKKMTVPKAAADDAVRVYERGSTILGAIGGGLIGWYKGAEIMSALSPRPQPSAPQPGDADA